MKKSNTTKSIRSRQPRTEALSVADMLAINGGKLSPNNCNALADNGFWVSYAKYC